MSEEKVENNPLLVILRMAPNKQQMAKAAANTQDLNNFKSVLKMVEFPQEKISEMEENGDLEDFMRTCQFLPIKGTKCVFCMILFLCLLLFCLFSLSKWFVLLLTHSYVGIGYDYLGYLIWIY